MTDLEKLQEVVDDLHAAADKFEAIGLADAFEGINDAAEAIKQAGEDAKSFRKSVLLGVMASAVAISVVVSYFIIDNAAYEKLSKMDHNTVALEALSDVDQDIKFDLNTDRNFGVKVLAITPSKSTRFQLSQDGRTIYVIFQY